MCCGCRMELALRVVGQRMTGRQEEPCNIARRIVAVGEMQSDQNTLMTRLAQSVIESDAQQQDPNSSRQDELIQFLTLLDVPNVGSRAVSTSTAVSLQNETGHTLLHLCAVLGFHALATDLLQRGADPDVRDATGQTALHLAALRGHVACARVLLEGRADADIVNAYGLAPVDVARERGSVEMLALLERADEESTEEDGGVEEIGSALLALDDSAGADADESDLEDDTLADSREPRPRVITESEEDIVSSASDANSESDIFADRPSRPSLDSITDVRPPFLGDIPKAPSTWFHRTLYNLQPQKAWPLPQINLPDMPALPAWPVTIPWPQTPEKGTFDLAAFRGFLGAKQQQGQQPDSGVRTMYPPPPQPAEAAAQGMSQAQLRTRLARRLGYYPTEVTEREMRAYTHHSQKMRKLKSEYTCVEIYVRKLTQVLILEDRMLVLFWLPILLSESEFGLVYVRLLTCLRSCDCLGSIPVRPCSLPCDGEQRQGPSSSGQSLMACGFMHDTGLFPVFISFLRYILRSCVILLCSIGFLGLNTTRPSEFRLNLYALYSIDSGSSRWLIEAQ